MTTLELQRRLAVLGFDPGSIDGVSGRLTIRAVKAFQASRGLEVDGIVGPKTIAALKTAPGDPDVPVVLPTPDAPLLLPWFEEAKRLKGLKEGSGSSNNPVILDWADDLDIHYPKDSIAWCGLFTAHCIGSTLTDEPLPTNPLGARNWLKAGIKCDPQLGAILVFWRGSRTGWQGHVGFYSGEDAAAFLVLGGNQSDSVSIARVAKDRLLGARWPATAPFLATGTVDVAGGGGLSENEA